MKAGRKFKVKNMATIVNAYYDCGTVDKACLKLGISRKTFYNTMKRLNLQFGQKDIV